jgi:hypothetical protein
MTRFAVRRIPFGRRPEQDDEADGLPTPARVKLLARRAAGIAEAKAVLEHLPGPGESLHAITTSRMDLTDVLNALLGKLGRCEQMAIASLGYGPRNLRMLLNWLDAGAVGELTLLASIFFKAHNPGLWQETLTEFRTRNQRAACAPSHAKCVSMRFASGERFALEGSANLRASGSVRENLALIHDAALADFHAAWIKERVTKYEGAADG